MGRARTRKPVYCDYNKYVYYDERSRSCIPCPKCAPGMGMNDMTFYNIKMDSNRGALQCRYCVDCSPGYTFSDSMSYDACKPCVPCPNGLFPSTNCTKFSNTECMKIIVKHRSPKTNSAGQHHAPIRVNGSSEKFLQAVIGGLSFSTVFLLVICIAMVCLAFWLHRRYRTLRKENVKFKAILDNETIPLNPLPPFRPMSPLPLPNERTLLEENSLETYQNNETYDYPEQDFYDAPTVRTPTDANGNDEDDDDYEDIVTIEEGIQNDKDNKLTDRNVRIAAKHLAGNNNHIKFASFLEIGYADVSIISTEHAADLQEQAYKVIIKWQQQQGDKATKSKLCALLRDFGRTDIVDQLHNS